MHRLSVAHRHLPATVAVTFPANQSAVGHRSFSINGVDILFLLLHR